MAIQWGPVGPNYFRLGIDVTGSGTTLTIIVYGQSVGYGHDWTSTVTLGGSLSGTVQFSFYSGFGATVTKEVYRTTQTWSGTRTFSASLSGFGESSVSRSVTTTSTAAPGPPSSLTFTRTSDTSLTISLVKGSGATTTQLTASRDGAAWYNLANPSGTTQPVTGVKVDSQWRFNAYSKNAGGSSSVVGPYTVYTKPAPPTTPTLGAGRSISWANKGRYTHGVEVQRTDNAGTTVTPYALGVVSSWTDPVAQAPLTQYRVRTWAGPSADEAKTFSDWSDWSVSVMAASYKPPQITKLEARRCDSAGNLTEMGTYLRVVSSGTASTVLDADGAETNKLTRKVGYRKRGATAWVETTVALNGAPTAWTSTAVTIGAGQISQGEAWEVRYTAMDTYSPLVAQQVTVSVSAVALSLGTREAAVGKQVVLGGPALQVAGQIEVTDPNIIIIGGTAYQASGIITPIPSTPGFTAFGSTYARTMNLPAPYTPPEGWFFEVFALNSNSYTLVTTAQPVLVGGNIVCRHMQIGNDSISALKTVGWQLTKL